MVRLSAAALIVAASLLGPSPVRADEPSTISLSDGLVTLAVPAGWEKKEPKTRIVEYEFAAPATEGDEQGARITVMGAGGGVEANIDRWIGQFSQPAGGETTKEKTFREKTTVDGVQIHVVDISGTFKDQMGPFAPATARENYRMIAGIVETEGKGDYFIKMYGPRNTVEAQEQAFKEMMKNAKVKK